MALKSIVDKCVKFLLKYRYVALIVTLGLVLMMLPSKSEKKPEEEQIPAVTEPSFEKRLAAILSSVEGAGNVDVILTVSAGEETLYQTNEDQSQQGSDQSRRQDTVTVSDANRNEKGLIKQVIPAVYQGAIIVCQGADNPSVCYNIVDAVSKLTGIGANCISVLKMK